MYEQGISQGAGYTPMKLQYVGNNNNLSNGVNYGTNVGGGVGVGGGALYYLSSSNGDHNKDLTLGNNLLSNKNDQYSL